MRDKAEELLVPRSVAGVGKYRRHQGVGERIKRIKKMLAGKIPKPEGVWDSTLVQELLELRKEQGR